MGFDVHGIKPKNEPGVYFRNNVWWWRPLWTYCEKVCGKLLTDKQWESGSYNDGKKYSEKKCLKMYALLQAEIDSGDCKKYKASYDEWKDNLPNESCTRCKGNNRGKLKRKECKFCDKTGETDNWSKHYPFNVENVQEFVNFLKDSGGMEIN